MSPVNIKKRKTKAGEPRYLVYFRQGSGKDAKTEYGGSFRKKFEAQMRRDLIAGELAVGRDPNVLLAAIKEPPPPPPGLDEQWAAFMESRVDVKIKAQAQYRNARDRWLPILGAECDPAQVTPRDIIDGIAELAEDLKPSTISQYVSNLGMVFDYADVQPNPVRSSKVKLPKGDESEIVICPSRTWFVIRDNFKRRSKTAMRLIEADGLRVSEAAELENGDIDFIEGRIRIRREGTKTAAGRRWVPVPPEILDELDMILGPREDRQARRRVFGLTAGQIRYDLERACIAAAGGNYNPHSFRHRRVSLWLRHGFDPITVARWAGHSKSSESLDTYGHVVLDPREDEWRDFWNGVYDQTTRRIVAEPEPDGAPTGHWESSDG